MDFVAADINVAFPIEVVLEESSLQVSVRFSFTWLVSCGWQVLARASTVSSLLI